jgi:hypothetical protein
MKPRPAFVLSRMHPSVAAALSVLIAIGLLGAVATLFLHDGIAAPEMVTVARPARTGAGA